MRYPDGGGLTAAERARREQVFGVDYTLAGLGVLLHRMGWSVQVPARRAAERDEDQIARWREETWPVIVTHCGCHRGAVGFSHLQPPCRNQLPRGCPR
jgi:hypothetical protein